MSSKSLPDKGPQALELFDRISINPPSDNWRRKVLMQWKKNKRPRGFTTGPLTLAFAALLLMNIAFCVSLALQDSRHAAVRSDKKDSFQEISDEFLVQSPTS